MGQIHGAPSRLVLVCLVVFRSLSHPTLASIFTYNCSVRGDLSHPSILHCGFGKRPTMANWNRNRKSYDWHEMVFLRPWRTISCGCKEYDAGSWRRILHVPLRRKCSPFSGYSVLVGTIWTFQPCVFLQYCTVDILAGLESLAHLAPCRQLSGWGLERRSDTLQLSCRYGMAQL